VIRLLAAVCLLLIVPGGAVRRLLALRDASRLLWFPGTVALSLAVIAPVLVLWPGALITAIAISCIVSAAAAAFAMLRPGTQASDTRIPAAVVLAAVGAAGLGLGLGAAQEGDSYLHLAIVQKILREGVVTPSDAFYAQSGADARYGFTVWHPLLASLSNLSFVPATRIWALLPTLIAPLYVLSVAHLAIETTQSRVAGSLAAIMLVLYHVGPQAGRLVPLAGNPSHVACLVLIPTALAFALGHVRRGGLRILAVGLATWAVVSVHPFHGLLELLVLTGLLLPFLLRGSPDQRLRAIWCLVTVALVLLPPALHRLTFRLQNPFWLERGSSWELTPSLWAVSPRAFFPARPGYLWIVYGLSVLHLFLRSSPRGLRGVAVAVLLPLGCALNPLVAPWLGARVSPQMLARLDHVTFYVLGFVLLGASAARLYHAAGGCLGGALRAAVILLLGVGFWQSWPGLRDTWAAKRHREGLRGFSVLGEELEGLRPAIRPTEVIAAEEVTGFMLPTFLPVRVVAVPRGSASPADSSQRLREKAVRLALDPSTASATRWATLEDYGAAAMILDTTRTPRVARLLAEGDPRTAIAARSGRFVLLRPAELAGDRDGGGSEAGSPSDPRSHRGGEPP
jgi:hypothetical protein